MDIYSAQIAVLSILVYELAAWPEFNWDEKVITPLLIEIRFRQARYHKEWKLDITTYLSWFLSCLDRAFLLLPL
jgi:hypothetical protein